MTLSVEQIIAQIDALTPGEKGELAYAFLCSYEPTAEVTAKWEAEVNRRLADTRRFKQNGVPARELFDELRQRARP